MKTDSELEEDTMRIMRGEEPLPPSSSKNYVRSVPDGFSDWVKGNTERIEKAKSLPYFLRDNRKYLDSDAARIVSKVINSNPILNDKESIRISLTPEQKQHRKDLQKNAIAHFSGKTVENVVQVKISSRGIKEFLNQPHSQYFEKNELIGNIIEVIKSAEYVGSAPYHKGNPEIVRSHFFRIQIKGVDSFLIARENADGEINLYSITDVVEKIKGLIKNPTWNYNPRKV